MDKKKMKRFLKTTCNGCGNCCTHTMVPINHADLKRLVKGTGKKASAIVRLFDSTQTQYELDRDGWIEFSYGKRIMGLRKKGNRCMFLDKKKRCTAYEHRPMTCRTFPLDIRYADKGKKGFRIRKISYIPGVKCKRGTGPEQDAELLLANAVREDKEDAQFYRKLDKWNRGPGTGGKKAFLAFLGL